MSAATSPAAALSWSRPRVSAVILICGLAAMSVSVVANQQVYIWRDQTGAIRFSPVPEAARSAPEAAAPPAPRWSEPASQPVITGASASGSY